MALARKTQGIRRNLKEKKRREQIKNAAINVFSEKGYDQATLGDIVAEAGVGRSLLYWYWESKSALLSELIDTCMAPYTDLIRKAVESPAPFPKKFHKLSWDCLNWYRETEKLGRMVHLSALRRSAKPGEEDFSCKVNSYYKEILGLLEFLFQQGMDSGHLEKNMDVEALALGMIAFTEGYMYMSILEKRMPMERMLALFFNAVQAHGLLKNALPQGLSA